MGQLYLSKNDHMTVAEDTRSCDRFWRDIIDPLVVVFSEIKRCQHPHSTQNFQKAKKGVEIPVHRYQKSRRDPFAKVETLAAHPRAGTHALVVVPTRDLAQQASI